ncbi:hypothetical protein YC2023_091075 [Brassica napus]
MIKTVMMMNVQGNPPSQFLGDISPFLCCILISYSDCNRFSTYELWFKLEKQHKLIHGIFSRLNLSRFQSKITSAS